LAKGVGTVFPIARKLASLIEITEEFVEEQLT
jgi:hypothetical protein